MPKKERYKEDSNLVEEISEMDLNLKDISVYSPRQETQKKKPNKLNSSMRMSINITEEALAIGKVPPEVVA